VWILSWTLTALLIGTEAPASLKADLVFLTRDAA
jgi:hypothetical protein